MHQTEIETDWVDQNTPCQSGNAQSQRGRAPALPAFEGPLRTSSPLYNPVSHDKGQQSSHTACVNH